MLGWPNHPIGGGRPPRLAWGGSAIPRPAGLGSGQTTPNGPRGGSAAPWAKCLKNEKFE